MSNSLISLGLGFGGGKASTSNGRISGGATPFTNAYSVEFDGSDDYINIPHDSAFNITGSITISAWFNLDSNTKYMSFLTKRASGSINFQFYNTLTGGGYDGNLRFAPGDGSAYAGNSHIPTGSWNHGAIVVDSGTYTFYLNGVADGTGSLTLNTTNSADLTIGRLGDTANYGDGKVDEVALFNSALSASDITAIYNSGVPTDISSLSPVGWWRMGDNDSGTGTTITDQGSGGNNGTLTNGPTFSTDRPYALPSITNTYSVDFDGSDDYMSIPDADIFSMGNGSGTDNAFSISGWFNADSIGTFHIATKDASSAREWSFRTVSSQLHFFAFGTGGGYIGRKYGTNLNTGQWYHAVVTYDASKASSGIKLYLNGTRVDDADYAGGTFTASKNTSTAVRVGGLQNGSVSSNGKLDEVAIFNTALSSSDITAIYNSGVPTDITSLNPLGWWRMGDDDSGSGTTVTDQGSGGNNGTLTNGPTFSTTVPS